MCQYCYFYSKDSGCYCMYPRLGCDCGAIKPVMSSDGKSLGNVDAWEGAFKEYKRIMASSGGNKISRIKPKTVSSEICFGTGRAKIITSYDVSGPSVVSIDGICGKPKVDLMAFPDECGVKGLYFRIIFEESLFFVLGEVDKCEQADYIFNCFVRAKVHFDDQISRPQLKKCLREYFVEEIYNAKSFCTINYLNGWYMDLGKYLVAAEECSHIRYLFERAKIRLPVRRFVNGSATLDDFKTVEEYFNGFFDKGVAAICFVIPYVALILSLLKSMNVMGIKPLVIVCNPLCSEMIKQILMTFDVTDNSGTISLAEKLNDIYEFLADSGDELIVANAVYETTSSAYRRGKLKENVHEVLCIANGLEQLPTPYKREFKGYLTILSDYIMDTDKAYVIEWDDRIRSKSPPRASLGRCWKGFVNWIENNWQKVLSVIRNADSTEYACFSATWYLIAAYYHDMGFELGEEPVWNEIFGNDIASTELLDIFRDSIIRNYSDRYVESFITYKDFYGFKSEGFEEFLARAGLAPYKSKIIKRLKDGNKLHIEDSSGNTYRVKDAKGNRIEYYLISKEFFDEPGELALEDIVRRAES